MAAVTAKVHSVFIDLPSGRRVCFLAGNTAGAVISGSPSSFQSLLNSRFAIIFVFPKIDILGVVRT